MMPRCHSNTSVTRWLTVLVAMLILSSTIAAQDNEVSQYDHGTPPQHAAGVSAIGSYISADIGTINLSNGALNFRLPLGAVGGRGFSLPLTLNYTSKIWSARRGTIFNPDPAPGHQDPVVWGQYSDDPSDIYYFVTGGWTIGAAPFLKAQGVGITGHENPQNGCTDYQRVLVKLTLVLPDKGEIELRDKIHDGSPAVPIADGNGCLAKDSGRGRIWHSTDGSGIVFIDDADDGVASGNLGGTVIMPDGTRYHFVNAVANPVNAGILKALARCNWVQDRNGNNLTIAYPNNLTVRYTDQLGRITTVQWDNPLNPGLIDPVNGQNVAVLVTLPGAAGSTHYYGIKTDLMRSQYRSGIAPALPVFNGQSEFLLVGTALFNGGTDAGLEQIDNQPVLTQLILPDGRVLAFYYNEYGEVAEVQMPAGGRVEYDYQAVTAAGTGLPSGNTLVIEGVAPGGGNVLAVDRAVVTRRTYPDGSTFEGTWTYSYSAQGGSGVAPGHSEVVCVAGGQTLLNEKHYYLPAQRFLTGSTNGVDGTGYSLWSTGLEQRSEMRSANGAAVITASERDWSQRRTILWESQNGIWNTGYAVQEIANDNRVTQSRNYLDDGAYSKADTLYDSTMGDNNHINNPVQVDEYDLDHTTLKRETKITYDTDGHFAGTGVNTVNILTLVADQWIYDGGDLVNAKSHASYEYDNYANDTNHQPLASYTDFLSIPGHDSTFDATKTERGNATKVTRTVDASTSVTSYTRYDVLGNVVSIKDARTNVSTISYLDDFGDGGSPGLNAGGHSTYALPSRLTSPAPNAGESPHVAYAQYDFSTGLLAGFKDRNGTITQTIYNDAFDRPKQIKVALGTTLENHTAIYYAPQTNPWGIALTGNDVFTARDQVSIDDGNLRSWTHTDGFGRTFESWTDDPQGDVKVSTVYDGLGRAVQTSNPFRPATETQYNTTTAYDLAGRVKTVTTADNAVVTTAYSGARVLVTDQAGKQRISKSDGLGRLTDVWEIRSTDSVTGTEAVTFPGHAEVQAGYRTTYGYDALDDLLTAKQRIGTTGTLQTRTFMYDGLKRLKQAINPESGTINYTYDANSNLETKQDARLITTRYTYDALNRVKSRTYESDPQSTPAVAYKYDNQSLPTGAPAFTRGSSIGRLVAMTYSGTSAGNYTGYDQLGRVNVSYQQTDSINYGFAYAYNLASEMTAETYPSGRQVITEYDTAGRAAGIRAAAVYYAGATASDSMNRIQYASHGAVSVMKLGNGKWEHTTYDPKRLQPMLIGLGTSGTDSSLLKLEYTYSNSDPSIHDNNGNVRTQKITIGSTVINQTYSYDVLNRLSSASENSGASWLQTYGFDRFGNRWLTGYIVPGNESRTPPNVNAFNQGNNQIQLSGFGYDAAGNLKNDPTTPANAILYDAENRQVSFTKGGTTTYSYDGDGHRVKKIAGSVTTVFVYNASGQLTAEYTNDTTPPAGGGGTSYMTTDHLGSTRLVTGTNQTQPVKARYDYLPFGEEIPSNIGGRGSVTGYGGADSTKQKFTQKERDVESALDYFGARYYSSAQGRFTSVDPIGTILSRLVDPQLLNRYSYVRNNPLKHVDPDGRDLKLKAGMKKADADRIMNINANIYRKASGRAALERMESSAIPITSGTGSLPTTVTKEGTKTRIVERYGDTYREGTGHSDAQGKLTSVDIKNITVTYDLEKRDSAQSRALTDSRFPPPDSEQHLGNHETGHVNELITNPVREISATTEQSEARAEGFAKTVEKEPNTMPEKVAEKRVKEMFGYENYDFADKKKKN